eukprot:scaffold6900_cov153-Pinguiococcus_pyrenoidosus.AAC.1
MRRVLWEVFVAGSSGDWMPSESVSGEAQIVRACKAQGMYWIRTRRGISYLTKYSAVLCPRNTPHRDTSFGRKHGSRRALLPPYNAARVSLRSGWMGFRALFPRSLCIKKIGAPLGSRSCFSHWVQHDNGHPRSLLL